MIINTIYLPHFVVTLKQIYLCAIMFYFFLSHLETSYHLFDPFFSLPTVILCNFGQPGFPADRTGIIRRDKTAGLCLPNTLNLSKCFKKPFQVNEFAWQVFIRETYVDRARTKNACYPDWDMTIFLAVLLPKLNFLSYSKSSCYSQL